MFLRFGILLFGGWLWLAGPMARAGELYFGAGYGPQVGEQGQMSDQHNAVVDLGYDVWQWDWKNLRIGLGGGASWVWNDYDEEDAWLVYVRPSLQIHLFETQNFQPYLFLAAAPSYI